MNNPPLPRISTLVAGAAALLMLAACATSEKKVETVAAPPGDAPPGERAVIDFAQFQGRIRDWRAVGSQAILIEDSGGDWYRADFISPCHGLPFAESIGFVTDATNQIDRFSSIMVRNERCWFRAFRRIEDPDGK